MSSPEHRTDSRDAAGPGHPEGSTLADGRVPPSSWYSNEEKLLTELRASRDGPHTGVRGAPQLAGYESLHELRRGGQGVVYRAVQTSTRRSVAIKVLREASLVSGTGLRRFERETDLVAHLRHPHIVRVYDSGVTPDGRAYLVMEFVEGQGLLEWARPAGKQPRESADILAMLARIADAVHHAHTRGVIHRDLKPSNIRVDADGEPRVLDFGLAKLEHDTQSGLSTPDDRSLTTTGQFVGSLPYASPEQAKGDHNATDTRSDVYALGAVLYHLLTGRVPIDVSGPLHQALTNVVEASHTPARSIVQGLPEQVDLILSMAMAKNPAQRYQSAAALADDLRAHLLGQAIAARREGTLRALARRTARYKRIAIGAGLASVAIAGLGVYAWSSAREAQRQRDAANAATQQQTIAREEADKARAEADAEAGKAKATVEFLANLLGSADPNAAGQGRETKVLDVLAKAGETAPETYKDQPATLVELLSLLAGTYGRLGMVDESDAMYRKALDVTREHPDEFTKHEDLSLMGSIASNHFHRQDVEACIAAHREVIAEYAKRGIAVNKNLASCWSDIGVCARMLTRYDEADEAYTMAIESMPEAERDSSTAVVLRMNHAMLMEAKGDLDSAITKLTAILPVCEEVYGADASQTNIARSNLAYLHITRGTPEQARGIAQRAVESLSTKVGASHPTTLMALNNLAKIAYDTKDLPEAERLYADCVARYEEAGLGASPRLITPLSSLVAVRFDMGRHEEALSLHDRVGTLLVEAKVDKGEQKIVYLNNRGTMLDKLGRHADATPFFEQAVAMCEPDAGVFPAGHWRREVYRSALAMNLIYLGRLDEGEAILNEACPILEKHLAPTSPNLRHCAKAREAIAERRKAAQPAG